MKRRKSTSLSEALQPARTLLANVRGLFGRQRLLDAGSATLKSVLVAVVLVFAAVFGLVIAGLFVIANSIWLAVVALVVYVVMFHILRSRLRREPAQNSGPLGWVLLYHFPIFIAGTAVGGFAGITALVLKRGQGEVEPAVDDTDAEYAVAAYEHYLWHLADSIPVLKIPGTLHWSPEHDITDRLNGALTLSAKILVLLPFIELVRLGLIRRSAGDDAPAAREGADDESAHVNEARS